MVVFNFIGCVNKANSNDVFAVYAFFSHMLEILRVLPVGLVSVGLVSVAAGKIT